MPVESGKRPTETLDKEPTMSKTCVTIETHESDNWLATVDMDLSRGQRFTFSALVPVDPKMTLAAIQNELIRQAAELLLQMQSDLKE